MEAEPFTPLQALTKAFGSCLTPELARELDKLHLDPAIDCLLTEYAQKANEGQLSDRERAEYEAYIEALDFVALLRIRADGVRKKDPPEVSR